MVIAIFSYARLGLLRMIVTTQSAANGSVNKFKIGRLVTMNMASIKIKFVLVNG